MVRLSIAKKIYKRFNVGRMDRGRESYGIKIPDKSFENKDYNVFGENQENVNKKNTKCKIIVCHL